MQKKIYILTKRRRRSKSIIEQTHTPINKKNQTNKEKKNWIDKKKKRREVRSRRKFKDQPKNGGNSKRKWRKLMDQPKNGKNLSIKENSKFDN